MRKRLGMSVLVLGVLLTVAIFYRGSHDGPIAQHFGLSVLKGFAEEDSAIEDYGVSGAGRTREGPTQEGSDNPGTSTRGTGAASGVISGVVSEIDHRIPVDAPLRGDPMVRDRAVYDNVINQFAVEENPRYMIRKNDQMYESGVTYCNIFVWDVTRAMGAEIPYWVEESGEPIDPLFIKGYGVVGWTDAQWMSANETNRWLNQWGSLHGWREVSAEQAQDLANQGHPSVASLYDRKGVGHLGIVRPGSMSNGPALAQAGTHNVNRAQVYEFFPREGTQFFVNDAGSVGNPT